MVKVYTCIDLYVYIICILCVLLFYLVRLRAPRPSATCPGRAFAVPAWDRRGMVDPQWIQ